MRMKNTPRSTAAFSKIKRYLAVGIAIMTIVLAFGFQEEYFYGTAFSSKDYTTIYVDQKPSIPEGGSTPREGGTSTTTTSGGAECLSLDVEDTLDSIISNSRQVFITMPAKAAGTSLKRFTSKCTKQNMPDNFINSPMLSKNMLTDSFQLPSIIASHLYVGDEPLVDLAQHSTRETLIVYIHRDETERLLSGIRQVLTAGVCSQQRRVRSKVAGDTSQLNIVRNDTHCTLDETPVVDLIEKRLGEAGFGSPEILTCKAYEAIQQNAPNMIFMHYTQADKLQHLLAKHHCPELMEEPSKENTAKEKGMEVYLRLKKGASIVKLDEWLKEKRNLLEWSLKLKKHASCQAKTRHMEDDLFACSDQTVKVSDIQHW